MAEEKKDKNELDDKDLNEASGGDWSSADSSYKSGDKPCFSVGQKVSVFCFHYFSKNVIKEGYIEKINDKKSGMINKEFTYVVKFDDGTTDNEVYESQMVG